MDRTSYELDITFFVLSGFNGWLEDSIVHHITSLSYKSFLKMNIDSIDQTILYFQGSRKFDYLKFKKHLSIMQDSCTS